MRPLVRVVERRLRLDEAHALDGNNGSAGQGEATAQLLLQIVKFVARVRAEGASTGGSDERDALIVAVVDRSRRRAPRPTRRSRARPPLSHGGNILQSDDRSRKLSQLDLDLIMCVCG